MRAEFYVVIKGESRGAYKEMRVAPKCFRKKPDVASDEVALKLNIGIPDSLFRRPMIEIKSQIPEPNDPGKELSATVANEIADVIQQQFGVKVLVEAAE